MVHQYEKIAADLRGEIERGELQPGDSIPSESALCTQYSTSRLTVQRALSLLAAEGLLRSQKGAGRTVAAVQRDMVDLPVVAASGGGETKAATSEVTALLALGDSESVVSRSNVHNGCLTTTWWPFRLVNGSDLADPTSLREPSAVLTELGLRPLVEENLFGERPARPDEQARLDLGTGAHVLVVDTVWFTDANVPVQLTRSVTTAQRQFRLRRRIGERLPQASQ